jgi:hypothetical protein
MVDVESMLSKLFTNDPNVTHVFYDLKPTEFRSTEEGLWFAVLQLAIDDIRQFLAYTSKDELEKFNHAFDWVFNTPLDELQYIGSFDHVCSVFKIDPDYLQKGLLIWIKDHFRKNQSRPLPDKNESIKNTCIDIKSIL